MNFTICAATVLMFHTAMPWIESANAATIPSSFDKGADPYIVGGEKVGTCGWPTAVDVGGGCTGTLIHPKAITTAQHCNPGAGTAINLGDSRGDVPVAEISSCYTSGSDDAAICELDQEVTGIPITPILFGCEVEKYMKVDQAVIITGYGALSSNDGSNSDKYWAAQKITAVEEKRVIIGEAADGISPCPGDSGGPVFVKVNDGSFRVFGTVWKGTTGIPCNSAAEYQRPDVLVVGFEAETGLDITPCFDAASGAWDPSPACTDFFSGGEQNPGSWDNLCEGTPKSGPSEECGSDSTQSDETSTETTDNNESSTDDETSTSAVDPTSTTSTTDDDDDDASSDDSGDAESDTSGTTMSGASSTEPGDDSSDDDDDDDDDDDNDDDTGSDDSSTQDDKNSGCACVATKAPGVATVAWGVVLFGLHRMKRRQRQTRKAVEPVA